MLTEQELLIIKDALDDLYTYGENLRGKEEVSAAWHTSMIEGYDEARTLVVAALEDTSRAAQADNSRPLRALWRDIGAFIKHIDGTAGVITIRMNYRGWGLANAGFRDTNYENEADSAVGSLSLSPSELVDWGVDPDWLRDHKDQHERDIGKALHHFCKNGKELTEIVIKGE